MLEMVDIGVENAIAYRIEGKVTEEDNGKHLSIYNRFHEPPSRVL